MISDFETGEKSAGIGGGAGRFSNCSDAQGKKRTSIFYIPSIPLDSHLRV
jgi:hypothetical protein